MDSENNNKQIDYSDEPRAYHTPPVLGRSHYEAATNGLNIRHKVHEMAMADRLFTDHRYSECRLVCYDILDAEPAEAIEARCHMYLAERDVNPESASART